MCVINVPSDYDHLFNSTQMGHKASQGPIKKPAIVDQMANTQRSFLNLIPAAASGSSAFFAAINP